MKKSGNITNTITYDYDSANQLTEFTDNDYIEKYTYDSVGNMLEKNVNGQATLYTFNEANQLITETLQEKTIEFIYNQNGDLVEKSSGEKYTYDIQGNLTSIVGNDIDQGFTYNGNGNRLSKTVDGETTYFVNDLNQRYEQVLQTYNDDGVIDTYTYGLQRISSKGQTNETYPYDGRGSVTGTVNASNEFVSYSYTAYGDLMPSSPQPNVFGYNGEQTDFDTGMQYLRARYYDAGVGRFIQEDIYRGNPNNPKSMHRYMYVYSNPVNYVDKSGFRPVGLASVNTHTLQQSKQTTHEDLLKEYQQKKLEAIAKSQDDDLRRIQEMKEQWIRNSQNEQGNDSAVENWNEYPEGQIELGHIPYELQQLYECAVISHQNSWNSLKIVSDKRPEVQGRVSITEANFKTARKEFVGELVMGILSNLPSIIALVAAAAATVAVIAALVVGTAGIGLIIASALTTLSASIITLEVTAFDLTELLMSVGDIKESHKEMDVAKDEFKTVQSELNLLDEEIEYWTHRKELKKWLKDRIENGKYKENDERKTWEEVFG